MAELIGLVPCGPKGKDIKIPLESISIQANIYGLLAHFEATFSYTNSTPGPIEVEFKHPLHSDSVLVGIEAVIDGRLIKGIVKEKEEAKAVYEDAIASGNTAALVTEETQDILGIALGNLPPGKKADVRLKLLQQLEVEEQGIHLLLPTTLKPRYELTSEPSTRQQPPINPSTSNPFASSNLNILQAIYKFSFELFLIGNIGELKQITSPSHPLEEFVAMDGRKGMHLVSADPLNSDLVAYIDYEHIHPLSAMIEPALGVREEKPAQHPFIDNPAVMLTFMPKSSQADSTINGEYIFVIDQSGSMSGGPIQDARETLDMLLRSLSPGSFFNIIGFGSTHYSLFPQASKEYNQKSLDKAVKHVKSLSANLGGTEILNPLRHIYSQKPAAGLARQLFLLTDGEVSNTGAVVQTVAANAHNTRVFTFGIGSGVSTDLVKNVAKAGKGKAVFISSKDRMQSRVMEAMNIAMSPSYTDISVTGSKQMAVYPKSIPVLFENEPFVVVAFFTEKIIRGEKMTATLKYSSDSGTKATTVEFSLADSVSSLFPQLPPQLVHQFGVSKALRDLEQGVSSKDECITLSCYTNVLSKHTAFVAVSEDQQQVVQGSMKVYSLRMTPVYMDMLGAGAPVGSMRMYCTSAPRSMPMLGAAAPAPLIRGGPRGGRGSPKKKRVASPQGHDAMDIQMSRGLYTEAVEDIISETLDADLDCDGSDDYEYEREFAADMLTTKKATPLSGGELKRSAGPSSSSKSSSLVHQDIMSQQKAEGFWEYSGEIENLLGCKDVKKSSPNEIKELTIWVTLLCIACLQLRFQEYKSEWLLVCKKGERWIQSKLKSDAGNPSYQQLLKLATDCLQK